MYWQDKVVLRLTLDLLSCRSHAASVLQIMHVLIHSGLIQQGILDGITMFACYFAGKLMKSALPWMLSVWSSDE